MRSATATATAHTATPHHDHGPPPAHTLEDAHIGNVAAEKLADIDGTAKNVAPPKLQSRTAAVRLPARLCMFAYSQYGPCSTSTACVRSGEGCTRMCGLQTDGRNMQHMEIQASRDACGIEHAAPELLWWQHV